MPGYRVAPDCGDDFSDAKIRACPVASVNQMAPLILAYRRHKSGLFPLSTTYNNPSCAVIEAFDVLDYNQEQAKIRASERLQKESRNV